MGKDYNGVQKLWLDGVMGCLCESWLVVLGINLSSFSDLDSVLDFDFYLSASSFDLRRMSSCLDLR